MARKLTLEEERVFTQLLLSAAPVSAELVQEIRARYDESNTRTPSGFLPDLGPWFGDEPPMT